MVIRRRRFFQSRLTFESLEVRSLLTTVSFIPHRIGSLEDLGASGVAVGDIDGDGDADIIATETTHRFNFNERSSLFLIRYVEGEQPYDVSRKEDIATTYRIPQGVRIVDLDLDGDLEIYSYSHCDMICDRVDVTWHENVDGNGTFVESSLFSIAGSGQGHLSLDVEPLDVDSDGDYDFLVATSDCSTVCHSADLSWYESTPALNSFTKHAIHIPQPGRYDQMATTDIDGDGDDDIVTSQFLFTDDFERIVRVEWFKNVGGGFEGPVTIAEMTSSLATMFSLDADADGDRDLMIWDQESGELTLHENVNGGGKFESQTASVAIEFSHRKAFSVADIDGDGDMDFVPGVGVAGALEHPSNWYENDDGNGVNWVVNSFAGDQTVGSLTPHDLDNDGDLDLVSNNYGGHTCSDVRCWTDRTDVGLFWFENRQVGDSNDDGVFNSSDLVKVFQGGEYEDDVEGNSTFDEGDWNGDGEFDSSDIVFAFQAGTFIAAARPVDIASAIDSVFENRLTKKQRAPFIP